MREGFGRSRIFSIRVSGQEEGRYCLLSDGRGFNGISILPDRIWIAKRSNIMWVVHSLLDGILNWCSSDGSGLFDIHGFVAIWSVSAALAV